MSMHLAEHLSADLIKAIRLAWTAGTSADEEWSADRPSAGQCAVTALAVQDHVGGVLLRGQVAGVSHYWNKCGDTEIDLTRDQFDRFVVENVEERSREYVLSFPETRRRYDNLRRRVDGSLTATV